MAVDSGGPGMRRTAKVLRNLFAWGLAAVLALIVTDAFVSVPTWWFLLPPVVVCVWLASLAAGYAARPGREPGAVEVAPPVHGRWSALNSPADRVPSHGTRELGQAYAIDVVAEPADGERPGAGWWPPMRPNSDFPAFGQPLYAVADATVVAVSDSQRDHLSRNSYPALVYLVFEGIIRMFGGARRIVGNHVILDLGEGVHAVYAHLRRGSAEVAAGDRVTTGQRIGLCGNSGNSSEPHLHFHLMDHPDLSLAHGIPFTWTGVGVPADHEVFDAPGPAPH
ncbi:hypothetical protein H4W79_004012 [Nocardiopsis terrae]|uniref:M23ase beta-sheet core domain-containing protein n=1 Tax=Nocardiopsis terrae TaxID=372655 RepID=A0ABR9HLA7_9ACTN|nr:M23 family metallopeptidase [Nocardiopsis terrae]MBE1459798.1 hypothetical protein [Nocardiopsis terrae]